MKKPDHVMEEEVMIGEGTAYELGGTLTLPQQYDEPLPAVVLVQGSGPSDRDSTAHVYKPFRDIAWGLAKRGIAVLRYDKRTFTHGLKMAQDGLQNITVHEETVEDAVLATNLLKDDPRINDNEVYLIGHSLGGMLAPRINDAGGDYAGMMILASSPRPLWEIVYDQNIDLLNSKQTEEAQQEEQKKMLEEEYEKAKRLEQLAVNEILEEAIFGVPALYFKDIDDYDTKKRLSEFAKPLLVLHGEDDFQVSLEKDFAMYKDILKDRENATLNNYPGLNHFFIHYEGVDQGTIAEYSHPGVVCEAVLNDMADWLFKQIQ